MAEVKWTEQVILVGVDAESSSHRLLAVLKVLTDAGLKNVCVLPKGSAGLTAQHLRVLTKTNEFFQVEIEELTEPELIDITEEGRTNGTRYLAPVNRPVHDAALQKITAEDRRGQCGTRRRLFPIADERPRPPPEEGTRVIGGHPRATDTT